MASPQRVVGKWRVLAAATIVGAIGCASLDGISGGGDGGADGQARPPVDSGLGAADGPDARDAADAADSRVSPDVPDVADASVDTLVPMDASSADSSVTVLATGQDNPTTLAIDGTTLYWTNNSAAGSVMACPTSGCATPTTIGSGLNGPTALAFSSTDVFWTTLAGGEIWQAPKYGADASGASICKSGLGSPATLVIDGPAIYWGEEGTNSIVSCMAAMTCATCGNTLNPVIAPGSFVLDEHPWLWWISSANGGKVDVCVPGDCSPTHNTMASGLGPLQALAIDPINAYFTVASDPGSVVMSNKVPMGDAGIVQQTLASGQRRPWALVIDGANVYFTTYTDGTVKKVSKSGGPVTTLATGLVFPAGIAVDATSVYASSGDGRIVKMPK